MKTEIEKVVKEKYPDNMKYGVEYQMDELRPFMHGGKAY